MIPGIGLEGIIPAGQPGEDDARIAARAFEAYFLRQIFSEFRKSNESGMFSGGFAGATFQEMLDGALADAMAAVGTGLGAVLERELSGGPSHVDTEQDSAPPMTSSGFGFRVHPIDGTHAFHTGVDLPAKEGTAVKSIGDGVVRYAGPRGGYGNLVIVDHGGGLETRYAHLAAIDVVEGTKVRAGTQLGDVGRTGRTTGAHLHFEVRRDGQPVDPKAEPELHRSPL